ncbi:hypothetical protein ACVI55_006999 [Sinorhizobium medicae]
MTISETLLVKLKDPSLAVDKGLIGAEWLDRSDSGKTFDVSNPATGEVIAILPDMSRSETARAIDAAHAAQRAWAEKTGKERAAVLRNLYDLVIANAEDLATILTMEMGKPLTEAKGEILYGASYVEWFGEEAKRVYGDTIPGHQPDKRIIVLKQPIGGRGGDHAVEFSECDARPKTGACRCRRLRSGFEACRGDAAVGTGDSLARRARRPACRSLQRYPVDRFRGSWQGNVCQ